MGSFQRREFMKLYTVIQVLFNPSLYLLTGKCTYSCFFILFLSYIISGLGIQSFDLLILKIARDWIALVDILKRSTLIWIALLDLLKRSIVSKLQGWKFAHLLIAHLLRSLKTNELPWAIRSGRSEEMSKKILAKKI